MIQYKNLLEDILHNGEDREDRTGVGTRSVFGRQYRFDLGLGFPLVTIKATNFHAIREELLWFLRGETSVNTLNSSIWNEWADSQGSLGPIYGHQWRNWGGSAESSPSEIPFLGIDQIKEVISSIQSRPHSRRHIVSAWNVHDLPSEGLSPQENVSIGLMALAPCHVLFQFYVSKGRLSCQVYQRSGDAFLGVPFNIASYALLTHIIAHVTSYSAGELVYTLGDAHLYSNHLGKAAIVLNREPRPLPEISIRPNLPQLSALKSEHINLFNYHPHPGVKAPIAV